MMKLRVPPLCLPIQLAVRGGGIDVDEHHGIPREDLQMLNFQGGVYRRSRVWHMDASHDRAPPEVHISSSLKADFRSFSSLKADFRSESRNDFFMMKAPGLLSSFRNEATAAVQQPECVLVDGTLLTTWDPAGICNAAQQCVPLPLQRVALLGTRLAFTVLLDISRDRCVMFPHNQGLFMKTGLLVAHGTGA